MEGIKEKNFFKKVWISIKDFEGYEEFAAAKVSKAIKYILLLTIIFTAIISIAYTYKFYLVIDDIKDYINENVEDIRMNDGKLDVVSNEPLIIENENSVIPIIIVDTSENANKEEYLARIKAYDTGILLLSDRIILQSSVLSVNEANINNEMKDNSILYSSLVDFNIENKEAAMNLIAGQTLAYICIVFLITIFIYLLIIYFTSNIIDSIVLGILGYLFARIMRLRLKYKATFNIGVYALTLPLILNLIYIIVNIFTEFKINYFQWMYTTISYIYVVVAILMIKTEIINQRIQLIKLREIQEQVTKEAEEQEPIEEKKEKQNKEKKEENNKEDTSDGEPEGSNA